jgi:four helix bundle protein
MAFVAVEKLEIYRLAEDLADRVWNLVIKWDQFAKSTTGEQLVNSSDSVGANIAEGAGRGSPRDSCRFVRIARGSLLESRFHLRRAYLRNLIPEAEVSAFAPIYDALLPKLNAYHRAISSKIARRNTRHKTQNTNDRPPNT